ncbi:DivIVA domain-containing protein [Lachnoclostridium phytofermentans]|uniref:DivIVA family protein n=1 Tax=Lachnoclostridium phytofermentans (strain ATCC 700394 / DSM 18823 / ISDg) TaxID=357809 RepID=A9KKY8_LACP7|nr:DivIVA domain-containing protein [Lachnoclostridium phytofermentans]ABX42720.1 DivIVA family protein [Lachnoclostridium phytofermentans ISDg]
MITPIEIQSKTFKSGGLGYDKKDVDSFLREVLLSYEQIYRENMEMKDKISVLTEGIQYYKTIEKTLQKALVLAEKTAEDTKAQALVTAKNIENEAMTRAQIIVADAKNELEHLHAQTIGLLQQYEKYKLQFKNLAAAQIELLQSNCFDISIAKIETFVTLNEKDENVTKAENDNFNEAGRTALTENNVGKNQMPPVGNKNNKYDERVGNKNQHINNKNHHSNNKNQNKTNWQANSSVMNNKNHNFNNNKHEKKQYQVTEKEYMDALEQVSAASEEITLEEYNELMKSTFSNTEPVAEQQDEFSFINLEDDED